MVGSCERSQDRSNRLWSAREAADARKGGNILNSPWFAVTFAHHSTCSQGDPQKVWTTGGTFTTLLVSCCIPL